MLQGLRKPVNDLSRGALVDDIVNTVAITAVQAQGASKEQQGATGDDSTNDRPVLVLNAGSSSLKYQLVVPETGEKQARGTVERIGESGSEVADHSAALERDGRATCTPTASTSTTCGCAPSVTGSSTAVPTSPSRSSSTTPSSTASVS